MDFNEIIRRFRDDNDDPRGAWAAMLNHLATGVSSGHITATELIESLFSILHPDVSPQSLDIRPFFTVAAYAAGEDALTEFFHSMWLVRLPGAYGVLCQSHPQAACECGSSATRNVKDMTADEEIKVNRLLGAVFKMVIPDEEEIEVSPEGLLTIKVIDPAQRPEILDKMVRSFRSEIDSELGESALRDAKPGDEDWMNRWMT